MDDRLMKLKNHKIQKSITFICLNFILIRNRYAFYDHSNNLILDRKLIPLTYLFDHFYHYFKNIILYSIDLPMGVSMVFKLRA